MDQSNINMPSLAKEVEEVTEEGNREGARRFWVVRHRYIYQIWLLHIRNSFFPSPLWIPRTRHFVP